MFDLRPVEKKGYARILEVIFFSLMTLFVAIAIIYFNNPNDKTKYIFEKVTDLFGYQGSLIFGLWCGRYLK